MKRATIALFALALLLPGSGLPAVAAPEALSPEAQAAISAAVTKELAAYGGAQPVPGAIVGVWLPGKAAFTKGFGYGQLARQVPIAIDDHVRIGSITKTFDRRQVPSRPCGAERG